MKQLLIETIRIDGTQSRAAIDQATVTEYVEAIQAGAKMPPILAYFDGSEYWLADGFHRFMAHQKAEKRNILAEVKKGTKEDAAWASAGANVTHGLRRTPADRKCAVKMAIGLRPDLSDEALAQHCGVHRQTVMQARNADRQVVENRQPEHKTPPPPTRRTGVDGKSYPVRPSKPPTRPPVAPPPSGELCAKCGHERADHHGGAQGDECAVKMPSGHGCACCAFKAPTGATPPPPPSRPPQKPPAPRPGPKTGQVDETGHTVPDHLLPLWERRSEIEALLAHLSAVRVTITDRQDAGDPLFAELNTSAAMANLNTTYDMVKATKPHAVCPWCHGTLSDQCRACHGRGMIGSFAWGRAPKELKKGRE